MRTNRRNFVNGGLASSLALAIAPALSAQPSWSGGRIRHLVPVANHSEIQIKAIFSAPQGSVFLHVGDQRVPGRATDTDQTGWSFHARDLAPNTAYELSLWSGQGRGATRLSDPWPLKTFPHPEAEPEHTRLLLYTCAGGHPLMSEGENSSFQPMETRRALLARGLSFQPDALIAIGDQIYWDQRTVLDSVSPARRARGEAIYARAGLLDRALAAAGTRNEDVLKIVAGEQITPLYGVSLRSTPSYFIHDDHDYFENDEATKKFVTLPPYNYQLRFTEYVRNLYLPSFLKDAVRRRPISGDQSDGTNSSFGSFRWGKLLEVLMYDCAGYLSLKGVSAGLVPDEVEHWLKSRTADDGIRQLIHVPSHPMGWSAGKWREWYPDVADSGKAGAQVAQIGVEGKQFTLTKNKPKFMWQPGWWSQHQRLLQNLHAQKTRPPIMMSGDLHATGHAQVIQSGDLNLSDHPVNTFITGPLGTGSAWPSRARGTAPQSALDIELNNVAAIQEKNGFTLVDAYPDRMRIRQFSWRREEQTVDAIASLNPHHDITLNR